MHVAVIITAYGQHALTDVAVAAVRREPSVASAWVIDNQGDYQATGSERVIRPGRNLGWLIGTNVGLRAASQHATYDGYVLLNNDVDASSGFFACLVEALNRSGADLVGPTYDGFWAHQHTPAPLRRSRDLWRAPFLDGTCILLTPRVLDSIGGLDPAFAKHGWGGEIDYALRARAAGHRVIVTAAAHLNHFNEATALAIHGPAYRDEARQIMYQVMNERYGAGWDVRCGIGETTHNTMMRSIGRRWAETVLVRTTATGLRAKRRGATQAPCYVDLG